MLKAPPAWWAGWGHGLLVEVGCLWRQEGEVGAGTSRVNRAVLVGPRVGAHGELARVLEGQRGTLVRESRGLGAAGVAMGAWEDGGESEP